jgi:hypothetical protein
VSRPPSSSASVEFDDGAGTTLTIPLKDPFVAGFLAWLVPGAGHIYQGRTAKGLLFSACILGTFFYGLFLGEGRVVYASWRPTDQRLPFICQVGVGLPTMPALVQAYRIKQGKAPLWSGFMAPPRLGPTSRVPPTDPAQLTLSDLTFLLNRRFEIGTAFTMIAGLLNVLAIYDAWGGPMVMEHPNDKKKKKKEAEAPQPPPAAPEPKP